MSQGAQAGVCGHLMSGEASKAVRGPWLALAPFFTVGRQSLSQLCYTNRNWAPICPLPGQAQSELSCPKGWERASAEQWGLQLELWTFVNTLKLWNSSSASGVNGLSMRWVWESGAETWILMGGMGKALSLG